MVSKFLNLSQDSTLGGGNPSLTRAVSEKSIKEYVDGGITGHNASSVAHSDIRTALTAKQDIIIHKTALASSGTINLVDNSINTISPTGTVTFNLPTVTGTDFHQILVQITLASAVTINVGTTYFFNNTAPDLSEPGQYNLIYEHDGLHWVCGAIIKGTERQ